jgi:hypothetical protein
MRSRWLVAPTLAITITCLSSAAAHAGGWDSLRFPRDHYLVGQVADVRSEFFAGELEGTGAITSGPYFAFLLPGRGSFSAMIEPPTIPKGSIPVGPLQTEGPIVRDGYRYAIASLTFTVPDIPSGRYTIGFCDDPCVHSTVGWLGFGWITIVHTPYEAALLDRIDRQRTIRWRLKNEARKAIRAADALQLTLGRTQATVHTARLAARSSSEGAIAASDPIQPERGASSVVWLAVLATILGVTVGVSIGRKRPRTKVEAGRAEDPVVAHRAREREYA